MKRLIHLFIALTVAVSPIAGWTAEEKNAKSEVQTRFENITYSLDNFENVLQELTELDRVSSAGISSRISEEVGKRFAAAVKLAQDILLDKSMSDEKKNEYLREIFPRLGNVVFRVLRHFGEDIKNTESMLKEVKDLGTARMVLREFMLDTTSWFKLKETGFKNDSSWGPADRIRRDRLSQEIILELQGLAIDGFQKMDEADAVRTKGQNFWVNKVVEGALQLREGRLNAQRMTAITYLGIAFWGLLAPHVDVIGLVDGRSENSLFASSVIYASFWVTIASVKAATISTKTLKLLRELKLKLQDPRVKEVDAVVAKEKGGLAKRIFASMSSGIKGLCGSFLSK